MNYGMYISASGMSASMARQDVIANNLANVNTTAFKPDFLALRQRDPVRVEDHLPFMPSSRLLERLGAGVMPSATRIDASPAALEKTGGQLDLGIEGEGFLVVRAAPGPEGLRLTRDGRLALSPDGRLVTAGQGAAVLDTADQPIRLDHAKQVEIRAGGEVVQDGQSVAQLQLASVPDPSRLIKAGAGLLRAPDSGGGLDRRPAKGRFAQGSLESSGVDAVKAMMEVTGASRAVEANSQMIGYINETMGRAINSLGRVT